MGNSGSGGCPYTNQGQAIDAEKNNIYGKIRTIRGIMDNINSYNINNKYSQLKQLQSLAGQIQILYNTAQYREYIRDTTALNWENELKYAISNKTAVEQDYYNNLLINEQKKDEYHSSLNIAEADESRYQNIVSKNNEFQQTINAYTKSYYDLIFTENSVLEKRINNPQYKDMYSTDNQKINYGINDNEYLKSLNYAFLVVYYILAVVVLYIIFLSKITNFSKIVMILIILAYPFIIYNIQHTLHYFWVNLKKPVV